MQKIGVGAYKPTGTGSGLPASIATEIPRGAGPDGLAKSAHRPGLGAYGGVRLVTSDWANLARMFERLGDGAPAYGPPIVRK